MSKRWTEEEVKFLNFAYGNSEYNTKEIANELSRSVSSVNAKARVMGLKKEKEVLDKGLKRCCRCKTIFTLESFSKQNISKNLYTSRCKECDKERMKNYKKLETSIKDIDANKNVKFKKCSKCKEIKNSDEFPKNISKKDGLGNYCKICDREIKKENKLKNMKERGW